MWRRPKFYVTDLRDGSGRAVNRGDVHTFYVTAISVTACATTLVARVEQWSAAGLCPTHRAEPASLYSRAEEQQQQSSRGAVAAEAQ